MQAQIVGIRQELSFEDGETASYIVLRLPNGSEIQTLVDDDTVRLLTDQFVKTGGAAANKAVSDAMEKPSRASVTPAPARSQPGTSQVHPALAHNMEITQAGVERNGNHTPLRLADDADSDYVFGGSDESAEDDGADVAGIQQQFRDASDRIIGAVESTDSLSAATQLLENANGSPLPVPSWAANETRDPRMETKAPRSLRTSHVSTVAVASAVHVEADIRGNPILSGAGMVDPQDLTGPSDEDGEAAQL